MRRLYTSNELGLTRQQIRTGELNGRWRRAARGVYAEGPEPVTPLDATRESALASDDIACRRLAAVLLGLDSVSLAGAELARWRMIPPEHVVTVGGVRCTDGTLTMVDLAAVLDDLRWEQALESALRKRLTTIAAIEALAGRRRGASRIRRVVALRPPGAPPTESLLETLFVQLARPLPDVPEPLRQVDVFDEYGHFVARVDLAWPDLGLFVELDGQHHRDQPVYDAIRETAVVTATGWRCGRFTWHEVVHLPTSTARRLRRLVATVSRAAS